MEGDANRVQYIGATNAIVPKKLAESIYFASMNLVPRNRLDLTAPIIANVGLGGLALRRHVLEYADLVYPLTIRPGSYFLSLPFEATYAVEGGSISFCVDVRNGKVFRVSAHQGYSGSTPTGVKVGMSVPEAYKQDASLFYDEAEGYIVSNRDPGIVFELPVEDPLPSDVPSMLIHSISVYATEIETGEGLRGLW